ncbi:unnamed protein product [Chironomus riparius]|uniref:Uncharacterized protein n=1 Tax=Chironomus riparius TaxID=315576 RepID=A0A9N9RL41_9DIPT|nr:unnamed protein product [Chironomus riparius]
MATKEPMLDRCCCFSLRSGGLVLGWLAIVIGFGGCIITTGFLFNKLYEYSNDDSINLYALRFRERVLKSNFVSLSMWLAFVLLIHGISGVLLVVGIKQNRHMKMMMYMVLRIIETIYLIYLLFSYGQYAKNIIKEVAYICLNVYYYFVVYSLYVKIKTENMQPQLATTLA